MALVSPDNAAKMTGQCALDAAGDWSATRFQMDAFRIEQLLALSCLVRMIQTAPANQKETCRNLAYEYLRSVGLRDRWGDFHSGWRTSLTGDDNCAASLIDSFDITMVEMRAQLQGRQPSTWATEETNLGVRVGANWTGGDGVDIAYRMFVSPAFFLQGAWCEYLVGVGIIGAMAFGDSIRDATEAAAEGHQQEALTIAGEVNSWSPPASATSGVSGGVSEGVAVVGGGILLLLLLRMATRG